MWHRYAKCTIGWLCPSSSRCKEVRGQPQKDQGRTSGTMCTCEEIERGTHVQRASKLGLVERWWTQDGKLGITIQDPPPESGRRKYFLYFTYWYRILSRVWKLATSMLVLRHYEHLFLFSVIILHVTSSRSCLYLLNIYQFTYTFSHSHIEARTHKHTCGIVGDKRRLRFWNKHQKIKLLFTQLARYNRMHVRVLKYQKIIPENLANK